MNKLAIDEVQISNAADYVKKAKMIALATICNIYEEDKDDHDISMEELKKIHCAAQILETCQHLNNTVSR